MKVVKNGNKLEIIPNSVNKYSNDKINIVGNLNKIPKYELEKLGIYDLIIPKINSTVEELGELYFDDNSKVATYTVVEKEFNNTIDYYKSSSISNLKENARLELLKTDWYEVRKLTKGTEVPIEISGSRAALIDRVQALENTILSLNNKKEIISFNVEL